MKKIKVLNFGVKDSVGDVFFKENIIIPEKDVYITKNFEPYQVIGKCKLSLEDDGIYISINEITKSDINGLYPAIGYITKKGGNKYLIAIDQISFCNSKNLDSTIKPIKL